MMKYNSNCFYTVMVILFFTGSNFAQPCVGGMTAGYPCSNIDLQAFLPLTSMGTSSFTNDIWGWTDAASGREFAILGRRDGTSFIEITNPTSPVYLGRLPTHTDDSSWRDIKTYLNHAFIVSEAFDHGMQVFDLTQLLTIGSTPVTFSNTAHYGEIGASHNIVINESTGYAYAVGSDPGTGSGCSGGLHMIDISNPAVPVFAGCFDQDGYTHDAQCVTYCGPDADYIGHEICFCYNTDTQTIVDVTDKSFPVEISRTPYPGHGYTHQGWLTEDQIYSIFDDETDENTYGHNTRTHVMDNTDLDIPVYKSYFESAISVIDHNQYIKGNYTYQANYQGGLRILRLDDPATASFTEVGYFDSYPSANSISFAGAWSVYPYFASGNVIMSGIGEGLFVLKPNATIPNYCPTEVTIDLLTDFNGNETTWEITEVATNNVVASNGPLSGNTSYSNSYCLPSGCYDFKIMDSAGNGICCGFGGNGAYDILVNGTSIRQGSTFASSESVEFCVYESNKNFCPKNLVDSGIIASSYQVEETITSDGKVQSIDNIDYKANCILLLPNFEVKTGGIFHAQIDPCK